MFSHGDIDDIGDDQRFSTASDLDFLFDLSPAPAELHLNASADDGVGLEQVFKQILILALILHSVVKRPL